MSRETQERTISHPSHPPHTLYLLPTPTYSSGKFICNACSSIGSGFSYHCPTCSFDLHTTCATLPLSVLHNQHTHPLTLTFLPLYGNRGFSCDICRKVGGNQWLYRCAKCQFDVHLGCASSAMAVDGAASSGQAMFANQPAMGSRATSQVARTIVQEIVQDGVTGDGDGGILDGIGEILGALFG